VARSRSVTPSGATLVYEFKRRNAGYAVGSACIGGGQGIALVLERI
jgi:acetyl-CoA C-acetyltransferase/acetyl-CoA acyltransferase 2